MKKASLRLICSFCVGIFCVAGCGQTGPLYLPDKTKPADKTTVVNTPAKEQSASAISQVVSSRASRSTASKAASSAASSVPSNPSAATSSK